MIATTVILSSNAANAVDVAIEINQAAALAGGITPSDSPGCPITLDVPGSYVMTSNLVPTGSGSVISASANDVHFDMNGFVIDGGGSCTGEPVTACTGGTGLYGIQALGTGVRIENGTVRGMPQDGIYISATGAHIDRVTVAHNGSEGIRTGRACTVGRVRALSYSTDGILGNRGCVMTRVTAEPTERLFVKL